MYVAGSMTASVVTAGASACVICMSHPSRFAKETEKLTHITELGTASCQKVYLHCKLQYQKKVLWC